MTIDNAPLLPSGFVDYLPEDAIRLHEMTRVLMAYYQANGYDPVIPPLIEYESSLHNPSETTTPLANDQREIAPMSFRLMDPISQNMMAIRTDMTWQVGRIIDTRLKKAPRPVRLCYMGDVMRVKGQAMQPLRQLKQIGCEFAGDKSPYCDAEIVAMALNSAKLLGLKNIGLDLTLPPLLPLILSQMLHKNQQDDDGFITDLLARLKDKDKAGINHLLAGQRQLLIDLINELMAISGDLHDGINRLKHINLKTKLFPKGKTQELIQDLLAFYHAMERIGLFQSDEDCKTMMTLDLIDHRGFDYHSSLAFHLFAGGLRSELAHGGRYLTPKNGETAMGFSVYCEELLRILPANDKAERLAIPHDYPHDKTQDLIQTGYMILRLPADITITQAVKQMKNSHSLTHYLNDAEKIISIH